MLEPLWSIIVFYIDEILFDRIKVIIEAWRMTTRNYFIIFSAILDYSIFFEYDIKNIIPLIWYRLIGLVGSVFATGQGDQGSIPGCVIQKTLKMVLDSSLLNTRHYKVRSKGEMEQSRERSNALPYTSV